MNRILKKTLALAALFCLTLAEPARLSSRPEQP